MPAGARLSCSRAVGNPREESGISDVAAPLNITLKEEGYDFDLTVPAKSIFRLEAERKLDPDLFCSPRAGAKALEP